MTPRRAKNIIKTLKEKEVTDFGSPGGEIHDTYDDLYERWCIKLKHVMSPCEIAFISGLTEAISTQFPMELKKLFPNRLKFIEVLEFFSTRPSSYTHVIDIDDEDE